MCVEGNVGIGEGVVWCAWTRVWCLPTSFAHPFPTPTPPLYPNPFLHKITYTHITLHTKSHDTHAHTRTHTHAHTHNHTITITHSWWVKSGHPCLPVKNSITSPWLLRYEGAPLLVKWSLRNSCLTHLLLCKVDLVVVCTRCGCICSQQCKNAHEHYHHTFLTHQCTQTSTPRLPPPLFLLLAGLVQ